MATSVDAGFNEFLDSLRSNTSETSVAASHRASIKAKLENAFGMTAFFRTGSFGNGTNVRGYSDVDYFAVIPATNISGNSATALAQVATALRERFPLTQGIRVDAPGVRVPFGLDGAEATEVVPVMLTGQTLLGFRQFDMPDGNGGWMFSAPESHNAYVNRINDRLNGKAKALIRLIKAWKFARGAPVKSFYLEMRTAAYCDSEQAIVYDLDVRSVLGRMLSDGLADFPDPRFPNDGRFLKACNTEAQRLDAFTKLQNAYNWADQAVTYNHLGKTADAFGRWDLVFNYGFPSYNPLY